MATKNNKSKKPSPNHRVRGKGKLSPVQTAFLVERYLADNNYQNSLASFRSEASDYLPKNKVKEVPKGMLGLGDILEEYIKMKGEKIMVDQEKQRLEIAFQGLQEIMRNYGMPLSPVNVDKSASGGSPPQGHMIHGSFISTQPPVRPGSNYTNRQPISIPDCSSGGKRKALSSVPNIPPPPKKQHSTSNKISHVAEGITSNTQVNVENTSVQACSTLANSSSPKTPPTEKPSLNAIISSETIIISPLKGKGYYSVERSYHVSTSPLKKLSPHKSSKREHVKGRLDFDKSCDPQSSGEHVVIASSPSMNYTEETKPNFDFDLPDFELFEGDFSKLLNDFEMDCEQAQISQQSSDNVDSFPCLEQTINDGLLEINQPMPNHCMSTVTAEMISQKDTNTQSPDSMTTMRSITKRVMISSP